MDYANIFGKSGFFLFFSGIIMTDIIIIIDRIAMHKGRMRIETGITSRTEIDMVVGTMIGLGTGIEHPLMIIGRHIIINGVQYFESKFTLKIKLLQVR